MWAKKNESKKGAEKKEGGKEWPSIPATPNKVEARHGNRGEDQIRSARDSFEAPKCRSCGKKIYTGKDWGDSMK